MRRVGSGGVTLQSIAIMPSLGAVAPGSIIQLTATGTYSDGSTANLTSAVAWTSSNGAVAAVTSGSDGGLLTAGAAGSCNITATLGVVSHMVPLTIPASSASLATWAIATSLGTTPEPGGRVYSMNMFVPPDVNTLNLLIANRLADGSAQPAVTVNVAMYQSDGTGLPTGAAFASFAGQVIPGDNSVATVGPFPGVVRGTDGNVVVLIGMAQGETPVFAPNCVSGFFISGTSTVDPAPVLGGQSPLAALCVNLDYNSAARHIAVLGDSITVGYDTTNTLKWDQTAFQLIAAAFVAAIDVVGVPGFGSLANFANFATYTNLWTQTLVAGADACIDLGTNDLAYNDLATMQTALQTIITHLQGLGAARIFAATIPPQASYPGTDVTRAAYNAWLKANFVALGITAVRDRAVAQNTGGLASNSDPNVLFAGYDTGDGTHINAAGNLQEQVGWEAIL